jgi:cell division protein FtsQ
MKLVHVLAAMVAGVLIYQGAMAVYQSAPLELRTIEVVGNFDNRVTTEDLLRVSGIAKGQRLLEVSTDDVASRIGEIPWIADARVERILPSKIRIEVIERKPAMVVFTPAGPYLVDAEGVVLQQGTENLVNVVDLPDAVVSPGKPMRSAEFAHALKIFNALPREIRGRVASIRASTVDSITVVLSGGEAIFYGAAEQLEDKNYAAQALLGAAPSGTGGRIIDVRVPSRPAIRPL